MRIPRLLVTLLALALLAWITLTRLLPETGVVPTAIIPIHRTVNTHGFKELWSIGDVGVRHDDLGQLVTAAQGMVFILGSIPVGSSEGIAALEGDSGSLIWQRGIGIQPTMLATPSALYVGRLGVGEIEAYEPMSGSLLWSTLLSGSHSVMYLYASDNELHAYTNDEMFYALETSRGAILSTRQAKEMVFLSSDGIEFVRPAVLSMLQARRASDQTLIWEASIRGEILQSPIFMDQIIFLRTGRVLGRLYAVDRVTGETLWSTENVVGNVVTMKSSIFALKQNGQLVGLNAENGETIASVQFLPEPFTLSGEAQVGGYYLAADETNSRLYVQIGDSRQLMAFELLD